MQPKLETERLSLRPFLEQDCEQVCELAGDKRVADMTANIPHPYRYEDAYSWIQTHRSDFDAGKSVVFAIVLKTSGKLVGAVSLPKISSGIGTIGYWLGVPFWGYGYAVEASRALIDFAHKYFDLKYIEAQHLVENTRSKRVIIKLGMQYLDTQDLTINNTMYSVCTYRLALEMLK